MDELDQQRERPLVLSRLGRQQQQRVRVRRRPVNRAEGEAVRWGGLLVSHAAHLDGLAARLPCRPPPKPAPLDASRV